MEHDTTRFSYPLDNVANNTFIAMAFLVGVCAFRIWQKKWGKTAEGSVEIDPTDMEGTYGQSPKGQGGTRSIPGTTKLTMDTPL